MGYRYFICDVFTDKRFGGNPLAALPAAAGLSDRQMQQVAREFGAIDGEITVTFEEQAGLVPVTIQRRDDSSLWCELAAPQPRSPAPGPACSGSTPSSRGA
jgi:predicted PhzF superfamily epimerase YddE/YHI9